MTSAYLVYNPYAGRFPSRMLIERAAKVFNNMNWDVRLIQTKGGTDITSLACKAVGDKMDVFIVAGGDGSVNLALAGLVGSDTALGILPAGTTNVMAQELGLPGLAYTRWLALEQSAHRLISGHIQNIDVGFCNNRPFLMWSGVGLDGFIVNRIEPRSRWEKHFSIVSYVAKAVRYASFWSGLEMRAEVDGDEISGHFLMAVISNIHLYAGGFAVISPGARLNDGMMDLWLFSGETIFETIRQAWDIFQGHHVNSHIAHRIPFQNLRLMSNNEIFIQVDGEPLINRDYNIDINVRQQILKIIVPRNAPRLLFVEN
jgi:YegS/Rv2252/BmrU family lipid kinase